MSYRVKDFMPLCIIIVCILGITVTHQLYTGWNMHEAMRIFMAAFFLVFGFFKVINLKGFAQAYAMYDLIAQQVFAYGYIYPFIEISLGFSYYFNWNPQLTNIVTFFLMMISALGVFNELRKGKKVMCACLGVVFKIPMTYVTLAEDLLMAFMALWMLLI